MEEKNDKEKKEEEGPVPLWQQCLSISQGQKRSPEKGNGGGRGLSPDVSAKAREILTTGAAGHAKTPNAKGSRASKKPPKNAPDSGRVGRSFLFTHTRK